MRISWNPGPPPGFGHWWIVWRSVVVPVEIGPALINRDNPNAALLIKTLGGLAYSFDANREHVTYHAVLESPEAPYKTSQRGGG